MDFHSEGKYLSHTSVFPEVLVDILCKYFLHLRRRGDLEIKIYDCMCDLVGKYAVSSFLKAHVDRPGLV